MKKFRQDILSIMCRHHAMTKLVLFIRCKERYYLTSELMLVVMLNHSNRTRNVLLEIFGWHHRDIE